MAVEEEVTPELFILLNGESPVYLSGSKCVEPISLEADMESRGKQCGHLSFSPSSIN